MNSLFACFYFSVLAPASHCACGDGCAVVDRCSNFVFLSQTWPVSLVLLTSVYLKKPARTNTFNLRMMCSSVSHTAHVTE